LLFPIVTVIMAAWLLGEQVTATFVIGGAVVLFGVWVGAFSRPSVKFEEAETEPLPEEATT
jgi:drug/metabolite transporter (DMT)-like permease